MLTLVPDGANIMFVRHMFFQITFLFTFKITHVTLVPDGAYIMFKCQMSFQIYILFKFGIT